MEPITLFARICDPAGVARRLRELVPAVHIDGPDARWSKAVVTFGQGRLSRTITLTHDPGYYAEPAWSTQMNGMAGYFSRFPESDRKARVIMLTTTFRFSLGTLFDPDYDAEGDPRLEILFAVAELLDGVLFTPSSLRDARGRILFGAGGEEEEDPDAVWPRIAAEVSVSDPLGAKMHEASRPRCPEQQDEDAEPPAAQRVARRALALTAVTARAVLEQGNVDLKPKTTSRNPFKWIGRMFSGQENQRQNLLAWVREFGIDDEFEPDEWRVLQRPFRRLESSDQINSTWRLEGLVVLAWALRRFDMPPHDQLVELHTLWRSLGLLDIDAAKALLASPTLRPREEIGVLRNRLFAMHWRLRNFHLRPEVMDFAGYARTCWFGPLDLSGLPLIEGDLALRGQRLDRASRDALSTAHSSAQERHQAVNWLWEGPARYSEASVAT